MTNRGLSDLVRLNHQQSAPAQQLSDDVVPIGEIVAPEQPSQAFDDRHQWRHFGDNAVRMHDLGWTVLPQSRKGKRMPGKHLGRTIQWGQYADERPSRELVEAWSKDWECWSDNIAVLLGSVSHNVFVIDIDVTDPDINAKIYDIAGETLGWTMERVGNAPKIALVYRVADAADIPPYGKFVVAKDGQPTEHAIEILGERRMLTFVGVHHSSEKLFSWAGGHPVAHGPEKATLVTREQIEAFYNRLVADLELFVPGRMTEVELQAAGIDTSSLRVPHLAAWGSHQWIELDGKVSDGREAYLWSVAKSVVRSNHTADPAKLIAATIETFRDNEHDKRRWTDRRVADEAFDKVHRALRMISGGTLTPYGGKLVTVEKPDGTTETELKTRKREPGKKRSDAPELSWINSRRASIPVSYTPPNATLAAERALQRDRATIGAAASDAVVAGIDAFVEDVVANNPRVHVIEGPTGVGKSSQALKRFAQRINEIRNACGDDSEPRGPLLFIVPQYKNVDDLRDKADMLGLDGSASDAELEAAAAANGIIADGDLKDYMSTLRRFAVASDLHHMTYQGKLKAGCQRPDALKALQQAGVPSSALCKKKVHIVDSNGHRTGETEEQTCPFYAGCPAIQQRLKLPEVDIVFLVKSFLTLSIPEEIKNPRGVVIDERFFDLLVKTTSFPLVTLDIERREPVLTKKEKEAGMDPVALLQDRRAAVDIAVTALKSGGNLGEAFASYRAVRDGHEITGMELVAAARRVCGSAMTSQAELKPSMSDDDIKEICARPTGTGIGEEYRFWKLVEEQATEAHRHHLDAEYPVKEDERVRLLKAGTETPEIRISWMSEANWSYAPTLLLDASTDDVITQRVLGGREIVRHKVPVALNQFVVAAVDRRLSMRSLFPPEDAPVEAKIDAARLLAGIRGIVSTVCGAYAHGRVLFDAPLKLRCAILHDWTPPNNADFSHYAATAGLDFARRHVAEVNLSRMELPVQEIDGLQAALTYGYANEPFLDPLGTGQDEDGADLYPHVVTHNQPLRDGGTAQWEMQVHAGEIARRLQKQYREEEHRQGAGRLRTVFREDTPTVINVSEAIPDDMIVDEVVGFEDLASQSGGKLWDAVRMLHGVVEPHALAKIADHLGDVEFFKKAIALFLEGQPEVLARYHRIIARLESGEERVIYAPAHLPDWKGQVKHVMQWMGLKGVLTGTVVSPRATEAAEPAPVDRIAEAAAAFETRETVLLDELKSTAIKRGEWRRQNAPKGRDIPSVYPCGEGLMEKQRLSMSEWMALRSIYDPWVRRSGRPLEDGVEDERAGQIASAG